MLHVLRHYLPLRKALLIVSETILLTCVLSLGMSSHLWVLSDATIRDLAWSGLSPDTARWQIVFSSLCVACLVQLVIAFNELYDFRVSSSRYDRAARFLGSAGVALVITTAVVAVLDLWDFGRVLDFPGLPLTQKIVLLTSSLALGFVLLYVWRHVFHLLLRRASFNERLLILGSGRFARRTVDDIQGRSDSGFDIAAVVPFERKKRDEERRGSGGNKAHDSVTGNPWFETLESHAGAPAAPVQGALAPKAQAAPSLKVVGSEAPAAEEPPAEEPIAGTRELGRETLYEMAARLQVDNIVVAMEERRGSLPSDELLRCRLAGTAVTEAETFFEELTGKIPAEAMRPSYLIFNHGFLQHPLAESLKRSLDFSLALLGILLTWPLMLVTAWLIRRDSPGPILFRQERVGRHGQPFTVLKFRSMRQDAERATGPVWAQEDDPRITKIGRFLRRSRIDELPQLFNVLAGSMSLVGPRPERPHFVEELTQKVPYFPQRHIVKPGVTGWAQINYPYGNTLEDALQKLQYDLFYIKYQSFLFDLSILFHTVKTVLLRKGT